MVLTYTHNSAVGTTFPTGQVNKYRLRAKNSVGLGTFSTVYSVTCDEVPIRLNTPELDTGGGTAVVYNNINIKWAAITLDADTGADPISYY